MGQLRMQQKQKPFWMDESEWKTRGLPKLINYRGIDNIVESIPVLNWIQKGNIIAAYVEKDGLINYHFYKKDRKEIFDKAHIDMDQIKKDTPYDLQEDAQNKIAKQANKNLEEHPWWPGFSSFIHHVFNEHFKYQPFKVDYYPEVDSWSIIMNIPNTPTKWSPQHEVLVDSISKLTEN
jgi:hypothetical protein